jgi:hypothetical protein
MSPYRALGGKQVATTFYILFGWLLFNFAFAVGMYIRPKRKRPIDLIEGCTPEDTADIGLGLPGSDAQCFRSPHSVAHKSRLSLPLATGRETLNIRHLGRTSFASRETLRKNRVRSARVVVRSVLRHDFEVFAFGRFRRRWSMPRWDGCRRG